MSRFCRILAQRFEQDRGDIAVTVLLIPVALFAIFGTIHFGLVYHGSNVATAAAHDGFHAAAQYGAEEKDGESAAKATLGLFTGIKADPVVTVTYSGNTVTVHVTGEVATPLEWHSTFDITVTGPREDFYKESERG